MKILFLDDEHVRHQLFKYGRIGLNADITAAWDYDQAVAALIKHEPFDVAYLDHDLGMTSIEPGTERTGYDVAYYIASMPVERRPKKVIIHSWNHHGRLRMAATLRDAGVDVSIQPFGNI